MPNKAFLKKKSFLDDFRDNQEGTGYIQSARAERTWNNPITRGKRTKKLNTWIKSFDGKRHIHKLARFNRMQHENLEEAMSLTKFTDVVTDKLIKQYDVDEDDVLGYVESHSQELQELLDDKELSLKEKVLFLREEITGVKNETKQYERAYVNVPCVVYKGDAENAGKAHDYLYKKLTPIKGGTVFSDAKPQGSYKFCRTGFYGSKTAVTDLYIRYKGMYDEDFWNDCDADPDGWVNPSEIPTYNVAEPAREAKLTDKPWQVKVEFNLDGKSEVANVITDASSEEEAKNNTISYVSGEYEGSENIVVKDAKPLQKHKSEAGEPADEKLSYEKGHKNSDGENAPWVIRSHKDNRILASFANKKDAKEHLQRMKQYSKTEKKSEAVNMGGFKNMLRTYNAKGGSVKNGPWRICDGAYDLWFELYYNETPILGCTDNICKWYSNPETVGMTLEDYKKIEDAISSEIFAIDSFKMPESKQSERQGYAPYYFCRSKYTDGELAVLADGDSIHYLPSYNIKGFKDKIDYGTIATSFEPIENPETSELHKIVQRKDGRNIIALTQAEFDDFAENNGWGGRDKWFQDILRNRHIIESNNTHERAVDDYDTLTDGLSELGFVPSSNIRNGMIYPYRSRFTATKDGVKYHFWIHEDPSGEYTDYIEVWGGKFTTNGDPEDPESTKFNTVSDVLDGLKSVKKSESLINKNEMEAVAEAEESRILDAVQKAAKEAGVDDRLKVSSDKVLVKATLPIDNHDIGEITWVIDGVNGKLTEYVDGKEGYSKKFTDEDPLKDELRICFAAVKDVAGIPESKKTEAVHFEYTDTIRVPQWLWVAYQTGEAHDLNEDELEILDKFKEEYGSKYHMDDKSEDPYFSSRNDFDNLGGNVYDVDLYVEKPVENKRTEALSTNLEHPFSFKFKFDSPRVTYAMRDEADSGKYDAKLAVIDNDATDVEIFTDSPKAVLKLLDGVAERYNDTYKGMLTRDDLENHFTEAIALVKDVDDDLAAKYFVAFNGKEPDGLVVSGELDNVVSFLEAVK